MAGTSEATKKAWKDVPYEKRAERTRNALAARWAVIRPAPKAMEWAKKLKVSLKTAQSMNPVAREALLRMTPSARDLCIRLSSRKYLQKMAPAKEEVSAEVERMMKLATKRRA